MLIADAETLNHAIDWINDRPVLACDTETSGLDLYTGDRMVGVSLGDGEFNCYLPFRHGEGPNLSERAIPELMRALQTRKLIFHNASFDLRVLANEGLDYETVDFEDTELAAHLVNEQEETFRLKGLADKYGIGRGSKDEDELYAEVKARVNNRLGSRQWKGHMWKLPSTLVEPYASADTELTWGLHQLLQPYLRSLGYLDRFTDEDPEGLYRAEMDYARVLTKMEHRGLKLDRELLLEYKQRASVRCDEIQAEFARITGKPDFNPGSNVQLKQAFGWKNCTADYIETLGTPEAELILDYKAYNKARGSYYDAYLLKMDDNDVLRPNFRQAGTATGRLSCSSPNLQAVPRYNDRQPIKDLFVARDGHYLLELDLAQAELRVVAYFAHVPTMLRIFEQGRDLHTETANELGIPRDIAKRINLSAVYGIGAGAFARKYKMSEDEARKWLNRYHAGLPEIKEFYKWMMRTAERNRYIQLPTGRYRRYNLKESNDYDERGYNHGEQRASSNFIQGVVAELMRIAMTRIDKDPDLCDVRMLLTVHDSILLEVPAHRDPGATASRIARHMTEFGDMPLSADAKHGTRWGKMEHLKLDWSWKEMLSVA